MNRGLIVLWNFILVCFGFIGGLSAGAMMQDNIDKQIIREIRQDYEIQIMKLNEKNAEKDKMINQALNFLTLEGITSWYGYPFHGRPTSSRKLFDKTKLTAAHRSLPFGTQWLIKNKLNGKSIIVEITDRGPFIKGRILDLSEAAAIALDIRDKGICGVMMEPMLRLGIGD